MIVRRHEHVGGRPRGVPAGVDCRGTQGFQPFQRLALGPPLAARCPGGDQRREHPIWLWRPVGRGARRAVRGTAHAGEELDLQDEAHSFWSLRPSPSKASSRLR